MIPTEVIATYTDAGVTYEIDHLGIAVDSQWGEFAVYRDGVQVAEFATDAAGYVAEHRPALPDTDELIALAKQTVATAETGPPMRTFDQRADLTSAHDLVRRRINIALTDERPGDHRQAFTLHPIIRELENWAGTSRYNVVTWGVFLGDECVGHVDQRRSGRLRFLPYGGHGWRRYDQTEQARHPITPSDPAR